MPINRCSIYWNQILLYCNALAGRCQHPVRQDRISAKNEVALQHTRVTLALLGEEAQIVQICDQGELAVLSRNPPDSARANTARMASTRDRADSAPSSTATRAPGP